MTTSKNILAESMHSLVTPEFSGTHEEMITAVNYWVAVVSQLRTLFITVSSHDNRDAIIKQLGVELAGLNAELGNTTASVVASPDGLSSMDQKLAPPDMPDQVPEVDLSFSEALNKIRENAGIKVKQLSPLEKAFK